ncbi:agmatine deiminase [Halomonas elongata]|uniref:Agmatine deiminase n=1 Tax=Halomonas elongata TaxID=2746 RepID=A0A1B8NXI6_HALEL|nr:agmatine deiminase [Halomonas elongata]
METIIWLPRGCYLDETDGHVDNLCCFIAPGQVALSWTDDPADPQHAISREALAILEQARDAKGRPLEVHKLPQPGPLTIDADEASGIDRLSHSHPRRPGDRMAGSYVNFYIGNSVVVMPLLDPARDDEARAIIEKLFPTRRVIGVPAREILLGGGNIHCITQQQPRDIAARHDKESDGHASHSTRWRISAVPPTSKAVITASVTIRSSQRSKHAQSHRNRRLGACRRVAPVRLRVRDIPAIVLPPP